MIPFVQTKSVPMEKADFALTVMSVLFRPVDSVNNFLTEEIHENIQNKHI